MLRVFVKRRVDWQLLIQVMMMMKKTKSENIIMNKILSGILDVNTK
jgi:hypothetical protein